MLPAKSPERSPILLTNHIEAPPALLLLIDEQVLTRLVSTPETMKEQLEQLIAIRPPAAVAVRTGRSGCRSAGRDMM
jgi:hypothetical protein